MEKKFEEFRTALRYRESSDDYEVVNRLGFIGAYQFGKPRLWDLGYSVDGWKPAGGVKKKFIKRSELLKSKELQDELFTAHIKDILNRIYKNGYDKYDGEEIGGVKVTISGMAAGVHLKGFGGLKSFVKSGESNSDAFGTEITEYIEKFGGYDLSELIN